MERIPHAVMSMTPEGRMCNSRVTRLCKLIILFCIVSPLLHSQNADILIVENPRSLTLYDVFQKSLAGVPPVIQPFTPLNILSHQLLLNDGITNTMKVEVDGSIFYILYDEKQRLAGSAGLGLIKVYRGKRLFRDMVEILVATTFRSVDRKKQDVLAAGERCIRFFSDGGLIYVKRLGKDSGYGWMSLPAGGEGKSWQVARFALTQTVLSPLVVNRLTQRIRDVNLTLSKIYSILGEETGKRFLPPQWRVDSTRALPTYIYEPAAAARAYAGSITELTVVLQTFLLETGFDAVRADNRIEIKRH